MSTKKKKWKLIKTHIPFRKKSDFNLLFILLQGSLGKFTWASTWLIQLQSVSVFVRWWMSHLQPRAEKIWLRACALGEGSVQPSHLPTRIKDNALCLMYSLGSKDAKTDNKGSDLVRWPEPLPTSYALIIVSPGTARIENLIKLIQMSWVKSTPLE